MKMKHHTQPLATIAGKMLARDSRIRTALFALILFALAPVYSQQGQNKFEAEVVFFGFHGFEPTKITRQPGPFHLALHNGTRIPSLEFTLQDDKGKAVFSPVKLGQGASPHYRDTINLGVGTYTFRVTELPKYTMTIVISPTGK
jgi:hypothetical protein